MILLVLPISGGGFVAQLALIKHMCIANIIPDVSLASSGGNVSAYIAAAGDWKWASIERISGDLNKSLLSTQWSAIGCLSLVIGYYKGNIYSNGTGIKDFFDKYFTTDTVKKYEIWTGSYNKTKQKIQMFCNRGKYESIINTDDLDHNLTQTLEPVFADGDIDLISKATLGSASVPTLVPGERIGDDEYIDGGVGGASPMIYMKQPILKHLNEKKDDLHIIYANSLDVEKTSLINQRNFMDNLKGITNNITTSQKIMDRLCCYDILLNANKTIIKKNFPCNHINLTIYKNIILYSSMSMLEIYPDETHDVNIMTFEGENVKKSIKKIYPKCSCRLSLIFKDNIDIEYVSHILETFEI